MLLPWLTERICVKSLHRAKHQSFCPTSNQLPPDARDNVDKPALSALPPVVLAVHACRQAFEQSARHAFSSLFPAIDSTTTSDPAVVVTKSVAPTGKVFKSTLKVYLVLSDPKHLDVICTVLASRGVTHAMAVFVPSFGPKDLLQVANLKTPAIPGCPFVGEGLRCLSLQLSQRSLLSLLRGVRQRNLSS